jgi:uncharacterized protein YrrD
MDFFEIKKPIRRVGLDQYIIGNNTTDPLIKIDGPTMTMDELTVRKLNVDLAEFDIIDGDIQRTVSGFIDYAEIKNLELSTGLFSELSGVNFITESGLIQNLELSTGLFSELSGVNFITESGLIQNLELSTGLFSELSGVNFITESGLIQNLELSTGLFSELSGTNFITESGLIQNLELSTGLFSELSGVNFITESGLIQNLELSTGLFSELSGVNFITESGLIQNLELSTGLFSELSGVNFITESGLIQNLELSTGLFSELSGVNFVSSAGIFDNLNLNGFDVEERLDELEGSLSSIDFSSGIVISGHVTASNEAAVFCKTFASGEQYLSNANQLNINFTGQLSEGSYDWRSFSEDNSRNTFNVEEQGYYDIDFSWKYNSGEYVGDILSSNSLVYKVNKLTNFQEILGTDVKFKTDAAFIEEYSGAYSSALNPVINIKNVFLTPEEEIYAVASHYSANTGKLYKISTEEFDTYINIEKKNSPASGVFTFEQLLDTPERIEDGAGKYLRVSKEGTSIEYSEVVEASGSIFSKASILDGQFINNQSGAILNFNGQLSSGSKNWLHEGQYNTLRASDSAFYDIDFEWTYKEDQNLGSILKSTANIYKKNISTNQTTYLGSDIRFKQDSELVEEYNSAYSSILKPQVNIKNVFLTHDDYIVAEIEHFSTDTGQFSISSNPNDTYLNLERKVNTAGASNFLDLLDTPTSFISGSGKFLKVSDDEKSLILTDEIKASDISGSITGSVDRYDLKEAFEIDENGDIIPSNEKEISDTMWILKNETDIELRANIWRYNTGPEAFTDDISF